MKTTSSQAISAVEGKELISHCVQWMLRESPTMANLIASNREMSMEALNQHWDSTLKANMEDIVLKANELPIQDIERLRAFIDKRDAGIVVATIHMGDYITAITALAIQLRRERVVLVHPKSMGYKQLEQLTSIQSLPFNVVLIEQNGLRSFQQVCKELQNKSMVVMFYDQPKDQNDYYETDLLNRRVRWVKAHITAFSITNSLLVPFITTSSPSGIQCELQQCFARPRGTKDSADYFDSVARDLIDTAGRYLKLYPSEWHNWPLVPEMLYEGGAQ
ncbi:MAG: hypothetical protein AB8B86_02545 [Pseudomonadales bacterium]